MDLGKLYPQTVLTNPKASTQELMRAFLVRTNFVPALRQAIGWRGLKDSSTDIEAWTAKISNHDGVFGLYFETVEESEDWMWGRYTLNYFPHPEEELVESLSLRAIVYTQCEDYFEMIRNFLSFPDFAILFNIGSIDLAVNHAQSALWLGLKSLTRQRTIAVDGLSIPNNGSVVLMVPPGDYDQDFPSHEVALDFFEVLAASCTFCLDEPPTFSKHSTFTGTEALFDTDGNYWETQSETSDFVRLLLGYGDANFDPMFEQDLAKERAEWRKGDDQAPLHKDALWWIAHTVSNRKAIDKTILGVDDRPKLLVVTGFLGSGKTTFLQRFIEYQVSMNRFVAVIQNEIGETSLDGKLLDCDYSLVEVDEGCVCCTLAGNLKRAVRQIRTEYCPDYIVLETTGLANPFNLVEEIGEVEDLVQFDSITTLVDGLNILKSLESYEVARNQIKAADILLLNKRDLLSQGCGCLEEVIEALKEINPIAPIVTATHGDVNPAFLYGMENQEIWNARALNCVDSHNPIYHSTHAVDDLYSVKLHFPRQLDRESFFKALREIPTDVFRIKGVVEFEGDVIPKLVQYVAGRFEISDYENQVFEDYFLICIGKNLETNAGAVQCLQKLIGVSQS